MRRSLVGVVLVVLLLVACSTTARISDVYTALDEDGFRRRDVFFTDTNEIHCIAEAGIGRPDVTIEGVIHQIRAYDFANNKFFETDRYLGYAELQPKKAEGNASGPTKIDLRLERVGPDGKPKDDAPYVAGSYVCEISLDGEQQGRAAFNIDFPPCPTAIIPNGTRCFGFYPNATECPKFGEKSADPAKCKCQETGWECAE